jgi:hypothetical protein
MVVFAQCLYAKKEQTKHHNKGQDNFNHSSTPNAFDNIIYEHHRCAKEQQRQHHTQYQKSFEESRL